MNLMSVKETINYLVDNTTLGDTTMTGGDMLKLAIKKGWVIPIQFTLVGEKYFYTPEFKNFFGRYKIKLIYRVPDEIIKENLLIYPYRYKAELLEVFEGPAKEFTLEHYQTIDGAITEYTDYTAINKYHNSFK